MKKFVLIVAVACQLMACNTQKKDDIKSLPENPKSVTTKEDNVADVKIYEGLLPCADCSGIETVLKIYPGYGTMKNYKFELTTLYKGKQPEKTFTQKGNFNYERGLENDPDGTVLVLNWDKPESDQIYYGYKSENQDKLYLLTNKREIIKSELNYFLTLKK